MRMRKFLARASLLGITESINNIVQIVAIIAAGGWAFYTFVYEDRIKPAAEPPVTSFSSSLTVVGRKDNLIAVQAKHELRNIGKIRIRILVSVTTVNGVLITSGKAQEKSSTSVYHNQYAKASKQDVIFRKGTLYKGAYAQLDKSLILDPGEPWTENYIFYIPKAKFDLIRSEAYYIFTKNADKLYPFTLEESTKGIAINANHTCPPLENCWSANQTIAEISLWTNN